MTNSVYSTKKLPLLLAISFSIIAGVQGLKAYRTLTEKAAAQERATESIDRWKKSYMALAGTMKRWESSYRPESSIQDLMSLYNVVGFGGYGLQVDVDTLILNKVEPVTQNGIPIGLTCIYLVSVGGGDSSGLEVRSSSYQKLFMGLKQLSERPDIYIGMITVKSDNGTPVAKLSDFCVLLRRI
jgi:hypothetical protein